MLLAWPEGESEAFLAAADREASLPLRIADCGIALAACWADAEVAQALIAPAPLRVVAPVPGRTVVTLIGVEYRDNPWGNYREAAVLFPVVPPDRPPGRVSDALRLLRAPQLVYRMPVDQEFTMHAGRQRLGMPKYLARIDIDGPRVALEHAGERVFAFTGPRTGRLPVPPATLTAIGVRHGEILRFRWRLAGTGLAVRPGGPPPEVGETHPLARELRALGLPRRPLLTASVRAARLEIEPPTPVQAGAR